MVPNQWEKALGSTQPNARPHANPSERLARMSRVARQTFHKCSDSVNKLGIPAQSRVVGTILKTHLTGSECDILA
jgi:hypothetical protein